MKFTKPKPNDTFTITAAAEWPAIDFETNVIGPHTWQWTIAWGTFQKSGKITTPTNKWDAKPVITNCGGTLTVHAQAGEQAADITVKIRGTNPDSALVIAYLSSQPNSNGFEAIIGHESHFKHFAASNEPIKSFDNGYGMCQLTTPAPSLEQIWNWKMNVDGGLKLFAQKRASAILYLSQNQRTYTDAQLKRESVCRWNGGAYHEWDTKAQKWVRSAGILCDSQTGNIGWDMTLAQNKDKTEVELHKRDSGSYSSPRGADAGWKYSGVCYADRILG